MSGLQSLYALLDKRLDLPCINAAQEFSSSLKSENDRHSLATNGLVPLLENGDIKTPLRILAGFLLYAVYAFTNTPNPLHDRLLKLYRIQRIRLPSSLSPSTQTLVNQQQEITQSNPGIEGWRDRYPNIREKASGQRDLLTSGSNFSDATESHHPVQDATISPLECVLLKLLNGEGDELSSFSPITLADVSFWMPPRYQRSFNNSVSNSFHSSLNATSPASLSDGFSHILPDTPSSTPLHRLDGSTISHSIPSSDARRSLPDDVFPSTAGFSSGYAGAGAPPVTQRTTVVSAFDSSRRSSYPSPGTYPLQLSPSSASSTLETSSVKTPISYVDASTFALPRTDQTRQVDASIFHIPQINRWSTPADATLAPLKDGSQTGTSSIPCLVDYHRSPIPPEPSQLQPNRNPGVIGSGRPISTTPPSESSTERRASYIGIGDDNILTHSGGYWKGTSDSLLYNNTLEPRRQASPFTATSLQPVSIQPAFTARQSPITPQQLNLDQARAYMNDIQASYNAFNSAQNVGDRELSRGIVLSNGARRGKDNGRDDDLISSNQTSHSNSRPVDSRTFQNQSPLQRPELNNPPQKNETDSLADAIVLYLMARERVLTLQEQKKLQPHLSMLTRPICVLRPEDIPSLVANNQDIAVKLLLFLFSQDENNLREIQELLKRVDLNRNFDSGSICDPISEPLSLVSEMVQLVNGYGNMSPQPTISSDVDISPPTRGSVAMRRYLTALAELPPTIQSFNVVGKLLIHDKSGRGQGLYGENSERIATTIRTEVLGAFISGCIRWIEREDRDEKEGRVHDDRVATAIGNLCRFYTSLIKNGIITADSEEDTTEIMSFALQFSRFDTAQKLYSVLVAARA